VIRGCRSAITARGALLTPGRRRASEQGRLQAHDARALAARQPAEPPPPPPPSLYSPPTDEQLANFVAAMVNAEADRLGIASLGWSPFMAGLML